MRYAICDMRYAKFQIRVKSGNELKIAITFQKRIRNLFFSEKRREAWAEIAASHAELRFREAAESAVGRKRSMKHQI